MSASFGAVARFVGLLVAAVLAASSGTALAADPVVAAAGDIACTTANAAFNGGLGSPTACRQLYTSDLLLNGGYDAILTLGDNQYTNGTLAEFQSSYALSWGRAGLKEKTYPAIGNHEGVTATSGGGYCSYFGAAAHCNSSMAQGAAAFYSWDVGTWHMVALNSNCTAAGGCDVGSPQYTWLSQDLAQHPTMCTLAYWHHARFSSGDHGNSVFMQPIWKLLYDKGADVVLSGHNHIYERFAPLDGGGAPSPSDGIREFVVGTGGNSHTQVGPLAVGSEVTKSDTYGVLQLTLHPAGYDFSFLSESGQPFADSGSGVCRDAVVTGDTEPPSMPGTPTSTGVTSSTVGLSWTASNDNVGVTGYQVLRDGAPAGSTAGNVTSFTDTGLSPGVTYRYTVYAVDAAGNTSSPSPPLDVATAAAGGGGGVLTFAPTDDATIDAANPGAALGTQSRIVVDTSPVNDMLLKFTVAGTGSGTTCLSIASAKLRLTVGNTASDNSSSGGDFRGAVPSNWSESTVTYNTAPAAVAGAPVASITTPVALGTAYLVDVTPLVAGNGTFTIRAAGRSSDGARYYSRNGNAANLAPELQVTCAAAAGDSEPPSAPGTPTSPTVTATTVGLSWTASMDNVGVTGYRVFRGSTLVGSPAGNVTSFTDTGLSPSTPYSYTVRAVDAAGLVSLPSGALNVTTARDTDPPSAPGTPTSTSVTQTTVGLSWTQSNDNVGVTGYQVLRDGGQVGTTAGAVSFTDTGLSPGVAYRYTVVAVDAAGNASSPSPPRDVTTTAAGGGAIAFVQQRTGSGTTASLSTALTPPSGTGHALVAVVALASGSSASVTSVTDSAGPSGSWVKGPVGFLSGKNSRVEIWYRLGAPSVPAVTVTLSASKAVAVNLSEWSGVAAVDRLAGGSGASSTTIATPSLATTNAADLVIGATNYPAAVTSTLTSGAFTGLTAFDSGSGVHGRAAYLFSSATGAFQASWRLTAASGGHGTAILALKAG